MHGYNGGLLSDIHNDIFEFKWAFLSSIKNRFCIKTALFSFTFEETY